MHFVPLPCFASFLTLPHFHIVKRGNHRRRWRNILVAAPLHLAILEGELLDPHLTQDVYGWNSPEMRRRFLGEYLSQQRVSIPADHLDQFQLFLFSRWKAILGKTLAIPFLPLGLYLFNQPLWINLRQHIQGMMQRFANHLQSIRLSDSSQCVSGICPLALASFHPGRVPGQYPTVYTSYFRSSGFSQQNRFREIPFI